MYVYFCDLCGCPIASKRHILAMIEETYLSDPSLNNFNVTNSRFGTVKKEICPTCADILKKLFENRKKV